MMAIRFFACLLCYFGLLLCWFGQYYSHVIAVLVGKIDLKLSFFIHFQEMFVNRNQVKNCDHAHTVIGGANVKRDTTAVFCGLQIHSGSSGVYSIVDCGPVDFIYCWPNWPVLKKVNFYPCKIGPRTLLTTQFFLWGWGIPLEPGPNN